MARNQDDLKQCIIDCIPIMDEERRCEKECHHRFDSPENSPSHSS